MSARRQSRLISRENCQFILFHNKCHRPACVTDFSEIFRSEAGFVLIVPLLAAIFCYYRRPSRPLFVVVVARLRCQSVQSKSHRRLRLLLLLHGRCVSVGEVTLRSGRRRMTGKKVAKERKTGGEKIGGGYRQRNSTWLDVANSTNMKDGFFMFVGL